MLRGLGGQDAHPTRGKREEGRGKREERRGETEQAIFFFLLVHSSFFLFSSFSSLLT
jgi:hypothetical protein